MKSSRLSVSGFIIIISVLGVAVHSHAALHNRGTDSLGYRLIYDTDLNVTWYDYTRSSTDWQTQVNWASGLTVNFGGTIFDNWRLPTTFDQSCSGYNCTNSEMGYLFYTELGNSAGGPLTNKGDFQNLQRSLYWSGTQNAANTYAWVFSTYWGSQGLSNKASTSNAIAVRPGDVSQQPIAPEPISSILFVTGGTLLAGRRFIRRKANHALQMNG